MLVPNASVPARFVLKVEDVQCDESTMASCGLLQALPLQVSFRFFMSLPPKLIHSMQFAYNVAI